MAYATLAELRAELKLGASETNDDTRLTACITRAQAFIESAECCNQVFEASGDSTRYFPLSAVASDGRTLQFDYPLADTPTTVTNANGEVIPATAYILKPDNYRPYHSLKLKSTSGYAWNYSSDPDDRISIAAKWAYSTSAPESIKTATLVLAKWLYRQKASNDNTDQPIMAQGGFIIMPSKLPTVFWNLVGAYKRR